MAFMPRDSKALECVFVALVKGLYRAAIVREQRKTRGFSQEAFGDACGIERGEHNPALVNILKIIAALEMQPSEFFKALDKPAKARRKMQAAP
ncbi:helix-turn-helix domain-containing protein [Ralstonia nicotianae]|uniref:helix-turn-helix domain-containing protein n=1 Tax=Ralstonia pseudosolanacearum TaxID=1310165 RepID=UPI002702C3A1|nr:helix-turn-helix transcriptional regulator [Ralstonia pseudosolanacearum]MDO3619373.1 helix-turn-helix transcriptional regulator [Ralstonia pseudosolanacearum]